MNHRHFSSAAAAVTVIAAALLTQACSSSPASSASAGASATAASAISYSQCMRSHAVPEFPDPVNGAPPKVTSGEQVGVTDARLSTAEAACQHLWPYQGTTQALTTQEQQDYLKAAACMRSHGFASFPDPVFSGGSVHFPIPASIDTTSNTYLQDRQTCEKFIPAGLPGSGSGG
jgi:hypothetical protein